MYLTKDITGAASKIRYGKAGDKVELIKFEYDGLSLVSNGKDRFYVEPHEISEVRPDVKPVETPKKKIRTR